MTGSAWPGMPIFLWVTISTCWRQVLQLLEKCMKPREALLWSLETIMSETMVPISRNSFPLPSPFWHQMSVSQRQPSHTNLSNTSIPSRDPLITTTTTIAIHGEPLETNQQELLVSLPNNNLFPLLNPLPFSSTIRPSIHSPTHPSHPRLIPPSIRPRHHILDLIL